MNENVVNEMEERDGNSNAGLIGKLGCGLIATIVGICLGITLCVASLIFFGFSSVRNSEPYQLALTTTQKSETAVSILGEPIEPGFFFSGSFSVDGPSGDAEFSIPVSGPAGDGEIHAIAIKDNDEWSLSTLVLEVDGERVQLIREQ